MQQERDDLQAEIEKLMEEWESIEDRARGEMNRKDARVAKRRR